jgi:hypothetical protein
MGLPQGGDPLVDRRDDPAGQGRLQLGPVGVALQQQQLQGRLDRVVEPDLELGDGLGGEDVVGGRSSVLAWTRPASSAAPWAR